MKEVLLLALLVSFGIQAETYVCEIENTDQTLTFGFVSDLPEVCEGVGTEDEFCWDKAAQFKLSIQTTELPFPSHVEYGMALEDDVYFQYTSNSSDIKFNMYLDENESVEFTLNGKKLSFSNCRYYDFNQK